MNKNLIAGAAILCALPTLSQGSGFALIEMNARGQGNAYAGAAAYTPDASTVYFNPAGMMKLEDDQIAGALHLIFPDASFTNDGSSAAAALGPAPPAGLGGPLLGADDDGGADAFVPNFYWVRTINDEMKFGLGVNTPFGLETSYDDGWVGRYHAILSDLRTININPSLAYRVNDRFSIGGGLNFMLGDVDLSNAIDFGAVCVASAMGPCPIPNSNPQEADGMAEFEADNFDNISTGFNFGLLYQISPQTSIGVAYRSEVEMKVKGTVDFTVPSQLMAPSPVDLTSTGFFLDGDIKATVDLPASMSFSLAHRVDKITWLADVTWTGWSSFEELKIEYANTQPDSVTTEDWDDTLRYSVGLDYQYSDQWVLRSGLALDETPVPNKERRTPRLPGNDRTWVSFGATYRHSEALSWDFGYSHLFIDDAKIENEFESSVPTLAATLKGEYEADVDIVSVQLNWKY